MTYADNWVAPRRETPGRSLPVPRPLRRSPPTCGRCPGESAVRSAPGRRLVADAGQWRQVDPRVLESLDRARDMPFQNRYVMVDTAGARLYMIEDGRIAGSMKVIVGKADPSTQTPMLASTIYYATLNPYWHVTPELVRSLIAKNVLDQGPRLPEQGIPGSFASGEMLDPTKVDWHAVAAGRKPSRSASSRTGQFDGPDEVRVRELGRHLPHERRQRAVSAGRPQPQPWLYQARRCRSAGTLDARSRPASHQSGSGTERARCRRPSRST